MLFAKFSRINVLSITVGCALLATSFVVSPAYGHHSFQMFDMQKIVTLEGRLTDFDFTNPHAYLTLEVTDEDGEVEVWEIETISAIGLRRRGIGGGAFAVGERLSIEANPARNEERHFASAEVIRKVDGTELVVGFQRGAANLDIPPPALSAVATSLSGIWKAAANFGQILDRPVLDSWPLTEKGRDALARYDGSQTPSVDCVPYTAPANMLSPATELVEVGETAVTLRTRADNPNRTIYIDGRPHPENAEPSIQGHSIGRWEDDVLVVDTVHFSEHLIGNAFGVPAGFGKHLTERFALSEDGTKINYSYSLEDPEFLTAPVAGNSQWTYRPDLELETASCDPEAARRFLNAF